MIESRPNCTIAPQNNNNDSKKNTKSILASYTSQIEIYNIC